MSEIVRDREKQNELDRLSLREREKERLERYQVLSPKTFPD